MNETQLQTALQDLSLGGLRYLKSVGSTNDFAPAWAIRGADDLSLVVAGEQTAGRGRNQRKWHTPPDSALAFSLILRPNLFEQKNVSLFTALGALALVSALQEKYQASAQIKWPNDVLINTHKVSGVLTETAWNGDRISSLVLGIGVNITADAVPPKADLNFPATCLEQIIGEPLHRWEVLHDILEALLIWRARLGTETFIRAWDENLAFRGEQVWIRVRDAEVLQGKLLGLNSDGSLNLLTADESIKKIRFGDVHLRPFAL
ncbi:MAG: biotin--[acetyl-CoA-carboxylase] ligase [Anaerolineales bacterium]|nr:biotin--[acetyl-CoA-carboxylase] ligase [Anaerolineales bacterium]